MAVLRDGTVASEGMKVRCVDPFYESDCAAGDVVSVLGTRMDLRKCGSISFKSKANGTRICWWYADQFLPASPIDTLPEQELRDKTRKLVEAARSAAKSMLWSPAKEEFDAALKAFDPPPPDVRQLAMEILLAAGALHKIPETEAEKARTVVVRGWSGEEKDYYVLPLETP